MTISLDELILALQDIKAREGSWVGALPAVSPSRSGKHRISEDAVVVDLFRQKIWVNLTDPDDR